MPAGLRPVVFLDLDDTILQTAAKCPPGARLHPAASGRDGRPLSFMTDKQRALFAWLDATATLVPTTARDLGAFRRVALPFRDVAVLNLGATLLGPDGKLDPAWDGRVRAWLRPLEPELERLRELVAAAGEKLAVPLRVRVIGDFELPAYVVAKSPAGDVAALERVHRRVLPELEGLPFRAHLNHNNLTVAPEELSKAAAVGYLLETRFPPESCLSVGFGDSLSDAPFLACCDYAMAPRGAQLLGGLGAAPGLGRG